MRMRNEAVKPTFIIESRHSNNDMNEVHLKTPYVTHTRFHQSR